MAATLQCTLHRAVAKQPLPPPPPIVLTLQGAGVTERTEEFAEFKDGQTSLGETVLSLKCELSHSASGRGYHKKEVFLAIKEAVRCAATSAGSCSLGRRPTLVHAIAGSPGVLTDAAVAAHRVSAVTERWAWRNSTLRMRATPAKAVRPAFAPLCFSAARTSGQSRSRCRRVSRATLLCRAG